MRHDKNGHCKSLSKLNFVFVNMQCYDKVTILKGYPNTRLSLDWTLYFNKY